MRLTTLDTPHPSVDPTTRSSGGVLLIFDAITGGKWTPASNEGQLVVVATWGGVVVEVVVGAVVATKAVVV